jgi:hypothetical protein
MLKIYNEYQKYGVDNYYKKFSSAYTNPHEDKITMIYNKYIKKLINKEDKILDIACGEGLICRLVNEYNNNFNIDGCDPYFNNKYCKLNLSFEDISKGKLVNEYNIAICCYAYHLISFELRYDFLTNLAEVINKFIIITPSKKINISHPLWSVSQIIREEKITIIILEKIDFN